MNQKNENYYQTTNNNIKSIQEIIDHEFIRKISQQQKNNIRNLEMAKSLKLNYYKTFLFLLCITNVLTV